MRERRYTTYMTDEIGPLPYCPGCGHGPLIKALDRALVELQPDPKDVVIVTDIGGAPLDAPLDIETDVAWAGYANTALRERIEPALQAALRRRGLVSD